MDETTTELSLLEKIEQILKAQRIVFEKIGVTPKRQQRKIKGAICNVPIECDLTCNQLPRSPDRSGIIMLKLKRKLQFRGQVYFQAARKELIQQVLNWLKVHNPSYKDILVDINNINSNITVYKMMQTIMLHINMVHQTMSQQIVILHWSMMQEK